MNFVREKEEMPKSSIRSLVRIAAYLGIIQGVVWTVLSGCSIAFYHMDDIVFNEVSIIYVIYLMYYSKGVSSTSDDKVIGPKEFSYFMYVYLILSVTWLIVSSFTLWAMKDKQEKYYDQSITAWSVVTYIASLLDLILLFVLSYDYHKVKNSNNDIDSLHLTIIKAAIGNVMTVAARGFVLWFINIVFAVILSKNLYQRYKGEVDKSPKRENRPVIDAYSGFRSDLPVSWQTPYNDHKPFDNAGFKDDNDDFPFSSKQNNWNRENNYANDNNRDRAALFTSRQNDLFWKKRSTSRDETSNGLPRVYPYQDSPRVAKIGKQQDRRSPPVNVNPPYIQPSPYIPDPDYSPPGSPKVRGVLRPKSNYAMY